MEWALPQASFLRNPRVPFRVELRTRLVILDSVIRPPGIWVRPVDSAAPPRALPQPPSLTTYRPRWRPSALPPETPAWPPLFFSPYLGPWFLQHLAWPPAPLKISPSSPHLLCPPHWGQQPCYASSTEVPSQVLLPQTAPRYTGGPLWKQGRGPSGFPSTCQQGALRLCPALALLKECWRETSLFPATAHI